MRRRPLDADPTGPSPFSKLAATHGVAMMGDALVTMAMAGSLFFSISPNAARGRVALSLLFTMAPFAVVSPFLGPAIDRSRRGRRVMVFLSCAGRSIAALVMARVIDGLLLFPAAFTALVLSKTYAVTKSALVPSAVDSHLELVEANAKLSIVGVLGGFLAALPGAALLRWSDAVWVLRLAAVVFAVGAVLSVRVSERGDPEPEVRGAHGGGEEEANAGSIVLAAVAMALLRAVVGFVTFLVAFGYRRADAPAWWFGLALASSMVGGLAAATVAPRLRSLVREERIILGSLTFLAAVAFFIARLDSLLWGAVVTGAVGLAASAAKLAFDAIVQRDAPDAIRGRSFARFEAGFQLVWVVGALLPVIVATPLRQGYDVIAIATLSAGLAYAFAPRVLWGHL